MARLTWQNVAAPDLSTAAAAYGQAGRNFQNAFAGFGDIARSIARDRMNSVSNAELARLAQVGGADQVDAYLQNLLGRVDPSQMNDNLINAVMGLRQNAQGYDTTRLNQANTQSVTNQRVQDTQFTKELREQSSGFNQALNEAYREQEAGNYSKADQIINDAIKKYPAAASQANVGGINRDLRTIRSAPDAQRFTEAGQLYEQNKGPIIEQAVTSGFDEQSVRTSAYEAARNRGLSVEQATRMAEEAFQVWQAGNAIGPSIGEPPVQTPQAPIEDSNASRVDRIIGSPDPSIVAPETEQSVVAPPTSLGGLPVDVAPEIPGSNMVDNIINPTAPQVPVETPMSSPEDSRSTIVRMTDPEYVRDTLRNNPSEVIDGVLSEVRAFDDELGIRGSNSVERAYRLYTSIDGVKVEEEDLFRKIDNEKDRDHARRLFDSAIEEVRRKADVSPEAAKAAILSTLDTRNWYGGLSVPQPSINRASEVAKALRDPAQSRALSARSAQLSTFRENLNTAQEAFRRDAAAYQNLRAGKPARMTDAGYTRALEVYEKRVSDGATNIARLTQQAREFTGLPSGNELSNQTREEPNLRDMGSTSPRVVGDINPENITVDQVAPSLREAGLSNTEIARNADNIQSDVDRIVRDAAKDTRTYDMAQNAVDSIIEQYTQNTNPALLSQMSPEEIAEVALSDDSGPYSAQRDAAVWGNIKKSLPNTKEFEPFKDMSPTELKKAAPRLLPLLQARAADNQVSPTDVIDRIIKKYTQ